MHEPSSSFSPSSPSSSLAVSCHNSFLIVVTNYSSESLLVVTPNPLRSGPRRRIPRHFRPRCPRLPIKTRNKHKHRNNTNKMKKKPIAHRKKKITHNQHKRKQELTKVKHTAALTIIGGPLDHTSACPAASKSK